MAQASTAPEPQDITVAVSYVVDASFPEHIRAVFDAPRNRVAECLEAHGARVVVVNAADPDRSAGELLEQVDGVVIMGGIDVDPVVYGEEITVDTITLTNREADEYEGDLVRGAQQRDAPVFGICRGSQVINVALGGSLIQDIGIGVHQGSTEGPGKTMDDRWRNHNVSVTPGTKLAEIVGTAPLNVRTSHHQSVSRVGDGLIVAAHAEDGIVEGVEATEGWIVGVQWHPEQVQAGPDELDTLIGAFVGAIRARL